MQINILSLLFSLAAFALALTLYLQSGRNTDDALQSSKSSNTSPDTSFEIQELQQRVFELEAQLAQSPVSSSNPNRSPPAQPAPVPARVPAEVSARAAAAEAAIAATAGAWPKVGLNVARAAQDPEFAEQRYEELTDMLFDGSADDTDRIKALRALARLGRMTNDMEMLEDVHILEVLSIAETSSDTATRKDAWAALMETYQRGGNPAYSSAELLDEPVRQLLYQEEDPEIKQMAMSMLTMQAFSGVGGEEGIDENSYEEIRSLFTDIAESNEDPALAQQARRMLQQLTHVRKMMEQRIGEGNVGSSQGNVTLELVN